MNYMDLVFRVLVDGIEEPNQRTGLKTRRLLNQTVELKSNQLFSTRKILPRIAAAEVAWMLSGTRSTEWLSKHTKIWQKFEDRPGFINTAYGYRWVHEFGRNQIEEAIGLLKKDPSTRQALVISWNPGTDGLMSQGFDKNVPCPFAFNLYIVAGKGFISVYQRSADVIIGIPYDLMTYYLLGQAIFNSVGIKFGGVGIMIGDAHIYENCYQVANTMIDNIVPHFQHYLDHEWTVAEILEKPDTFVGICSGWYETVKFPVNDRLEAAA